MMAWRSASFDYFHKFFREGVHLLDNPPLSFIEFRNELVKNDNVLADWFDKHFKKSDCMDDYIQACNIDDYLRDTNKQVRVDRTQSAHGAKKVICKLPNSLRLHY